MPNYFANPHTIYIPIWNSAGTGLVAGITTASMSATIFRDDGAGVAASAAPFSAGGGWYGLRVDGAENSADHMRCYLLVSASAANGFVEWDNTHDVVVWGTAQNGSAAGVTLPAGFRGSGTSSLYVGSLLELLEGPGAGQTRVIATMTSGGGIVVSSAFVATPNGTTIVQVRRQDQDVVDIEALVSAALSTYGVPNSAQVSAVVAGALSNYDVPTSADVSTIVRVAAWTQSMTEPASAPDWASVNRGQGLAWLLARGANRHDQTGTKMLIYNSAGTEIASASVGDDGSTAKREQFLG